jgi:hypothetical protein
MDLYNVGEGNFLKKVFLPPHPYPSKTSNRNIIKIIQCVQPLSYIGQAHCAFSTCFLFSSLKRGAGGKAFF